MPEANRFTWACGELQKVMGKGNGSINVLLALLRAVTQIIAKHQGLVMLGNEVTK